MKAGIWTAQLIYSDPPSHIEAGSDDEVAYVAFSQTVKQVRKCRTSCSNFNIEALHKQSQLYQIESNKLGKIKRLML
ncbi:hypothetical protein T265_03548 [Opisthorchis viverrini]|uniref:Uncharacterized protein n=1 Tax=Opisthorchis viverrini TaxID=6198 RepID=A0A074ZRC1_OPIVI|nr:hypothetical protein T265_03548 [Opisthorchis viverrini]KER29963.1 hypothetical protein T265_03548 [Opisthorchis viverrini]